MTINIPAIIATDLHKRYGSLIALDEVSLTVSKGSIFGLLGPNGAGKTTTIRIMTGLTRPDSDSISLIGHDIKIDTIEARASYIGYSESSNILSKPNTIVI
jgi:ABC-2 type transport system ATP-binding protein